MKTASLLLGLLLGTCFVIGHPIIGAASVDPNALAAAQAKAELSELRDQLNAIKRSNSDATQKWETLAQENSALSNRVADLHQTLLAQKDREIELVKQSHAFNMRLLAGAAIGLVVMVLLSYWFQIRCFNRVVEISRSLPHYREPALLEEQNSASSKLLGAIQLLESRIQHLEAPHPASQAQAPAIEPSPAKTETASANVNKGELTPVVPTRMESIITKGENGTTNEEGGGTQGSSASLLLAKGQILLDMDRLQEAVACFQEASAVDPRNAEAHFKKGIAWERMNRLELALGAYEEALKLNPKRAAAQVYKARVLQGLHRYDEALSVYDSALGKGSKNSGSTTLAT